MKTVEPRKFDPSHRHRLCAEERKKRLPPENIFADIGLKPGDTFVEVGCGTGFFTLPAASLVGREGRVFGLDISPEMISDLRNSAGALKLTNVELVLSSETEPKLPREATFYFLGNVFHELSDKSGYLDNIRQSMGPLSRLVIIDYHRRKTEHGPPVRERVSLKSARGWLERHGFTVQKVWRVNSEEYGILAGGKSFPGVPSTSAALSGE